MSQHLEHCKKVGPKLASTEEFLDWLEQTYGVFLDMAGAKSGTPLDRKRLLNEFYEVDPMALDKERVELLDQHRRLHNPDDAVSQN